jgi:hypothetical protein
MLFGLHFSVEPKPVPIRSLRPGMIIADIIHRDGRTYRRLSVTDAMKMRVSGGVPLKRLSFSGGGDGIMERDIDKLRSLQRGGKLAFSSVSVKQMLPFAPFLFAGAVLTLLSRGLFLSLFFP